MTKLLLSIVLSTFLILSFSLTGCGGSGSSGPGKADITFSSKKVSGEGFKASYIEAVKWTMNMSGTKYKSMNIQIANYDRQGGSYLRAPKKEGDRRVTLGFAAPSGQKLKVGKYSTSGKMAQGYNLSISIQGKGKTTGLYNGTGTGEITQLDDNTISGKVDLKDSRGTTIKGSFSTSWTKSK